MTFQERHALAATLEQLAQVLRQPEPMIACGQTDPDPVVEQRVGALRIAEGATEDHAGCWGQVVWRFAYRCAECGRWFHRECLRAHFAAHGAPRAEP